VDLDSAAALALRLMKRHGLTDWTLVFDNAKTRAGVCRYDRRQIGLSQPLTRFHVDEEVRDTILHEIAHALVGPNHGHDKVWRLKAREIGSTGERCITSVAGRLPGDWVGTCPAGHVVDRHRRPERVLACPDCSPVFSVAAVYTWEHSGRPAAMHPLYVAELTQLFEADPAGGGLAFGARALIPRQPVRPFLPVGTPVVIDDASPLAGKTGLVAKCGRTRYEVVTAQGLVSVLSISVREG
jgi:predicted SprT family Zn-dependent metalloprotease